MKEIHPKEKRGPKCGRCHIEMDLSSGKSHWTCLQCGETEEVEKDGSRQPDSE